MTTPDKEVDFLRNYRQLIERVDNWCRKIVESYADAVTCSRGCDSCCRHLTLFPVEGAAILAAVAALPPADAAGLRERARRTGADGPCPLLSDQACLLYACRPLICRTHGFPLLLGAGTERQLDYCPHNFRGMNALPASAVLDLDRLNVTLAGINALFLRESGWRPRTQDRLLLADFLLIPGADCFSIEK